MYYIGSFLRPYNRMKAILQSMDKDDENVLESNLSLDWTEPLETLGVGLSELFPTNSPLKADCCI